MTQKTILGLMGAVLLICGLAPGVAADGWFDFGRRGERGSGDIVTETREVDEFDRIRLTGSPDLMITVGPDRSVAVTTDDNLQDNIITEVIRRGTLLIETDHPYRSRRGVLVEITVPRLTMVELTGSGDIEIIGLKAERFELECTGSGDVELEGEIGELEAVSRGSGNIAAYNLVCERIEIDGKGSGDFDLEGQANVVDISLHGSGDLDARRLMAAEVTIRVHGSGDAEVYAESLFDGEVFGSGDIDVYGDPEDIDRHISGSGDINRR